MEEHQYTTTSLPQDLYFNRFVPVLKGPFNGNGLYQVVEEDLATRTLSYKSRPIPLDEARSLAATLNARHYNSNHAAGSYIPVQQGFDDDLPFLAMVVPYDTSCKKSNKS